MATTTTVRALRRGVFGTVQIASSGGNTEGDVIAVGDGRVGVVSGLESIADGDLMTLDVTGQFDILKNSTSDTYSIGDAVWYDTVNKKAKTAFAAGYLFAGRCVKASASGDVYVYTEINDPISGGSGAGTTLAPISLTTTAYTLDSSYYGRTMAFNAAANAACAVTLPAATGTGARMRFVVGTVSTGGYSIATAPTTDIFKGQITTASTAETPDLQQPWVTSTNSNKITLSGTTTGGVSVGDQIEIQDIASGVWSLIGFTTSSGSEATPLSHV